MKKFNFDKNKKSFILSLLLLVAVVGTAGTVALAVAKSNGVKNTFQAADNNTGIEEPGEGTPVDKKVSVKNDSSKNYTFIRARVTVSPEDAWEVSIPTGTKWEDGGDGFYYYCQAVAPVKPNEPNKGKNTTDLLIDGVTPSADFTGDTFDVTVYEESCVATTTTDVTLGVVKKAFEEAEKTKTIEVK